MDVVENSISSHFIRGIQLGYDDIIFDARNDCSATDKLLAVRDSWKESQKVTVFTTGVYDGLHPNHAAYLLQVKALGTEAHYNTQNSNHWTDLSPDQREEFVRYSLASDALRLVLSIDGDRSVAKRKGFDPKKGNSPRPIMGWNTRAMTAAGLSYRTPNVPGHKSQLIDAITVHGPDDFDDGSIHHDIYSLTGELQPEVWGVFAESQDILDEAPLHQELANITMRIIADESLWKDEILGDIKTTAIARRIKGEI